jgi:hypothetical protein
MELPAQGDEDLDYDPTLKNHGKININRLSTETKEYLLGLMHSLAAEPGILKAQVTFDYEPDQPPTVHVITETTRTAVNRWLT